MVKSYITKNPSQTKKLGEKLAKEILNKKPKRAVVIALIGELGGGKTTFLQGFAKGLGVKEKILSPTFVIMRKFKICADSPQFLSFYHIDCYRIQNPKEILMLGFRKIISDQQNIVAIEWADKTEKIMPKDALWVKFQFIDKNKRKITIK